jgi:hypothetical protein
MPIFIDFGQLCSSKPTARFQGNRTAVFMISTTCFQAGHRSPGLICASAHDLARNLTEPF